MWLQLVAKVILSYMTRRRNVFIKRSVSGCDDNVVSILSADFNHSIGVLYLGLGNGYVLGYVLSDLITAEAKEELIKERFCFKTYEMDGVTALKYVGRSMVVSKR